MYSEDPPTPKASRHPVRPGLYDPALEHDACGLALIVRYRGPADHKVVEQALPALRKLEHRGGIGSDEATGDGAAITLQMPHDYFAEVLREEGVELPEPGTYAAGIGFFAQDYRADLTTASDPKSTTSFPTTTGSLTSATDEESALRHDRPQGEINTVRGNRNWIQARESTLASDLPGDANAPSATPRRSCGS